MSEQDKQCGCPDGKVRNSEGKCVMPDVTFSSLVLSLNTSALFHLGEIAHPESGEKRADFDLAKNAIDTLILLQKKTQGNLDSNENELLTRIVYELKMRFVQCRESS
ncbi:MAG TPA: DUF1844 domain-containing protein [Desulfobulbaceae bacterium]|nr:DUF1844 domain-containing protein [Desulfobulbaceae bacterium]